MMYIKRNVNVHPSALRTYLMFTPHDYIGSNSISW